MTLQATNHPSEHVLLNLINSNNNNFVFHNSHHLSFRVCKSEMHFKRTMLVIVIATDQTIVITHHTKCIFILFPLSLMFYFVLFWCDLISSPSLNLFLLFPVFFFLFCFSPPQAYSSMSLKILMIYFFFTACLCLFFLFFSDKFARRRDFFFEKTT